MVEARVRQDLFRGSDHVPAERVVRMDAAAFARPSVLGTRSTSDGREAVLTYRGGLGLAGLWLRQTKALPPTWLAQCSGVEAPLKLLLVYSYGAGNADNTVGWNLTLPNPKVNRISGDTEPIGNFAYFGVFLRHRHDLVLSSNYAMTVRGQEEKMGRKVGRRGRKNQSLLCRRGFFRRGRRSASTSSIRWDITEVSGSSPILQDLNSGLWTFAEYRRSASV